MGQSVLVLGATGMAGHILSKELKQRGFDVYTTSRLEFDAFKMETYMNYFQSEAPKNLDFVVNCIGILIEESQTHPLRAKVVNSVLPKFLEAFYCDTETKVIHISTDCVFNGLKGRYLDSDAPNETSLYGRTKALGEIQNEKDITIRTSIIGPEIVGRIGSNTGLLHWFLTQNKGSTIQGYSKCLWSGISTLELVDAVIWAMNSKLAFGIKQVSRYNPISKYELLNLANRIFERQLVILPNASKKIDKSLLPSKNSFPITASYEEMLERLNNHIEQNKSVYPYQK